MNCTDHAWARDLAVMTHPIQTSKVQESQLRCRDCLSIRKETAE